MPTILHESEGLTIKENDRNQFVVVTLYYWADPDKRSEAWAAEASAGMSEAKWRKEYLIDYEAQFGEKVFPQIITHRQNIVVEEPYPDFPDSVPMYGGFDYGLRNPSSFHVYAVHDQVVYSIWELFEPCKNILDFARKIKDCPYWDRLRYIAADPSLWGQRSYRKDGTPCSLAEQFWDAGVTKLIRGDTNESTFVSTMRKHWGDPSSPTFRVFARCHNQVREFGTAVFSSMSAQLSLTSNYKETIVDHDNHSIDDAKYFFNSRPSLQQQKPFKTPIMVKRWLK